jgi:hypothetical protein
MVAYLWIDNASRVTASESNSSASVERRMGLA